jgi:hypothetical protein
LGGETADCRRARSAARFALFFGSAFLGALLGLQHPASAASDNSSNTYAADANGIVIPTGTLLAIEYLAVRESDTHVTSGDNIFAKLGAGHNIDSDFELFTSITRFVYFTKLFDHPLAVEAAFTGVNVSEANIGNLLGATSLGKDDFLKGYLQISYPLAQDLHLATDITHDFDREGGFKEDITAELRIVKFFLPTAPLK